MSSPTIITLALVLPLTVIVGIVVVWRLGRRVGVAYRDAVAATTRLEPVVTQLRDDAEVARREVDGLSQAMDRLASERAERRERR